MLIRRIFRIFAGINLLRMIQILSPPIINSIGNIAKQNFLEIFNGNLPLKCRLYPLELY
jgi:hypothetical protein